MTPDDIRSQRFRTTLVGGLNAEEVTAFLEDVADAYEIVQQHNAALEAKVRSLRKELDASPEEAAPGPEAPRRTKELAVASRLDTFRSAALHEIQALIQDAQQQAEALIEAANARAAAAVQDVDALRAQKEQEAEQVVAEARMAAEAIVGDAREREAALRDELERLSEGRLRLIDDMRTTVNAYQEWLSRIDPRPVAMTDGRYALAAADTNGARPMDDSTAG